MNNQKFWDGDLQTLFVPVVTKVSGGMTGAGDRTVWSRFLHQDSTTHQGQAATTQRSLRASDLMLSHIYQTHSVSRSSGRGFQHFTELLPEMEETLHRVIQMFFKVLAWVSDPTFCGFRPSLSNSNSLITIVNNSSSALVTHLSVVSSRHCCF